MWCIVCHCHPIISCFANVWNGLTSGKGFLSLSWKRSHYSELSACVHNVYRIMCTKWTFRTFKTVCYELFIDLSDQYIGTYILFQQLLP